MKKNFFFLFTLFISAAAGAQPAFTVSENPTAESFKLVGTDQHAVFLIDSEDAEVVKTAAECVAEDFRTVTGNSLDIATTAETETIHKPVIYAGTVGTPLITQLAEDGAISLSEIEGRWEVYCIQLISEDKLAIIGATPRGTAYGLFELSRLIGVTPWIWWADVTPEKHETLYLSGDRMVSKEPSVKYRGLFINDEDWGLTPWASKGLDSTLGNIGPRTYERILELLLRLRANCLWPAKHSCSQAFWSLDENVALALKYGIVMSSGDSMLRDNLWEWPRFGGSASNFSFAYQRDLVTRYWRERVEQSKAHEAIYDIGMRGLEDVPLIGYNTQEEQLRGLADIIATQRMIFDDVLGDATKVPQIYIPYKEALTLYNAGLEIPEDVTLCWVDDNFAYIRQLPTAKEQQRSGGNGVYYHLSYLGSPCSYLWLSTISPTLISYELTKGYENGMTTFWMINVGDIKPAEQEFQFCMDLAWDVERWQPANAHEYSRHWAAEIFGEEYADELGSIRQEYYRLAAAGKPETLYEITYTNEEMTQRVADYELLVRRVETLKTMIPSRLQDAFFQLVEYPIKGAADMNTKILGAKLSNIHAAAGNREEAMRYGSMSRRAYQEIVMLTDYYNNVTAQGKWNGIMNMQPHGDGQFGAPFTASVSEVADVKTEPAVDNSLHLKATDYIDSRGNMTTFQQLGAADKAIGVWPLDYTVYTAATAAATGPFADYHADLQAGTYDVEVRLLPNYPITTANDLRVGLSVDGGPISVQSYKTTAESLVWDDNVMRGYAVAAFRADVATGGRHTLRLYPMNPAVVISETTITQRDADDLSLTKETIVNYDFELYQENGTVKENTSGAIRRGVPYGWSLQGTMNGQSYGINIDGSKTHNQSNICWFKSTPMPSDFELYQVIPAEKLQPGVYQVTCLLFCESGYKGACRLFASTPTAGEHVQYYGNKTDYTNILTKGEHNTFAGYEGGAEKNATLHPMRVTIVVDEDDDLRLGIRSSNRRNNGNGNDQSGWFKVDYFTIQRIGDLPEADDPDALTKALIANYDFEYDANGNQHTTTAAAYGLPIGWQMKPAPEDFPGTYFGLFANNAKNYHGHSFCTFRSSGSTPMPEDFELSQTIPASKLHAGTYRISCRLWQAKGLHGQCRLFAEASSLNPQTSLPNTVVQYYGTAFDYEQNLTEGECNSFANYIDALNDGASLEEMEVFITISEGDDLRLGIRSGNKKGDGTYATGSDRTGWFRVDYFRIEQTDGIPVGLQRNELKADSGQSARVYNLQGQLIAPNSSHLTRKGLFIVGGKKVLLNPMNK